MSFDPKLMVKMEKIAEKFFGTVQDPTQIPINKSSREKLYKLSSSSIVWKLDKKGEPISWIISIPTTVSLMKAFLNHKITERALFQKTKPQKSYSAIYLCSAFTLPKYRGEGLAPKLIKISIESIAHKNNFHLFSWPTTEGGSSVVKKLEKSLGKKVQIRVSKKWILSFRAENKNIFEAIRNGEKLIETRAGGGKYEGIKDGDYLIFSCEGKKFEREIIKVTKFKTISALVKKYPVKSINPMVKNVLELTKMYESFPGYKERIKRDGILAFELKSPVK